MPASMTTRPLFRAQQPAVDEAVMSNPFRDAGHSFSLLEHACSVVSVRHGATASYVRQHRGVAQRFGLGVPVIDQLRRHGGDAVKSSGYADAEAVAPSCVLVRLRQLRLSAVPLSSQLLLQAYSPRPATALAQYPHGEVCRARVLTAGEKSEPDSPAAAKGTDRGAIDVAHVWVRRDRSEDM
ncbi:hypothetical protein ZWY2020_050838 [Hordeum vulgare]|nr:hypothetical protein ZWY2020_050838 [Hordeum vulgare]